MLSLTMDVLFNDPAGGRTIATPSDPVDTWLASLLGGTVSGDALLSHVAPDVLFAAASAHDIVGLVADRLLGRCDVPEALASRLRAAIRREITVDLLREAELRRLTAAFDAADIDALLIKGSHLAYSHYPRSDLRARLDTDVLIPVACRDRVHDLLTREHGYAASEKVSGDLTITQKSYAKHEAGAEVHAVDIHWRVTSPQVFAHVLTYDELARDAVPLPRLGPHARGLSDVHALLLACVHRVAHHADSGMMKWLYDIHLLVPALSGAQWREFLDLARARGVLAVCQHSLDRAAAAFGTVLPGTVDAARGNEPVRAERTAAYLVSRSKARVVADDLRALPSWRDKARLLGEHLFPSRAYMQRMYAPSSKAPLVVLYFLRIVRGAGRWLTVEKKSG